MLLYLDSSALLKLVIDEPESPTLRNFLIDADLVSSELVLTEVPRAIRRALAVRPELPGDLMLRRAAELLDAVGLLPLDRTTLLAAGRFSAPVLRSLDAIHVAAAASVDGLDGFVGYDERQSAAARLAGLRTLAPGVSAREDRP